MDADIELAMLSSLLDLDEFEVVESSWDRRAEVRRLTLVPRMRRAIRFVADSIAKCSIPRRGN